MRLPPTGLLVACAFAFSGALQQAMASPKVLFDSGNTEPMARFWRHPTTEPPPVSRDPIQIPRHGFRLPIVTTRMTPGVVEARPLPAIGVPRSAMKPLFLFGSDARSLEWVQDHHERLSTLGAVGMLVAARTDAEVEAARHAAAGLPLFGAAADAFAEAFDLEHYPVLITPEGISQE